jgi:hypothetical protein
MTQKIDRLFFRSTRQRPIDQCSNSPSLRNANDGQSFLNQESGLDAGELGIGRDDGDDDADRTLMIQWWIAQAAESIWPTGYIEPWPSFLRGLASRLLGTQ